MKDGETPKKWISDDTKILMFEKLAALRIEIGYEQLVTDEGYSELSITPDDPLGNAMELMEFDYKYRVARINVRTGHTMQGKMITDIR